MTRRLPAATLVALALVAGACGGDGKPVVTATTVGASSTSAPSTTPTSAPVAATTTTTTVAARPTVVDDVLRGGSEADHYTYRATFPKLQGLADARVQDTVNADLRAGVQRVVDEFVAGTDDFAPLPDSQPSALDGTYRVTRLDDRLASFQVTVSRYFSGAAHPGAVLLASTYDLVTGRRLALADLFTVGAPYLDRLSELSRQLLLAQPDFDQLQDFVLPGTEPKAENFAGWTVTDQDLVITFSEYQVAPYAMGMPHVSIPFASLRTLLDPAGPLAIRN